MFNELSGSPLKSPSFRKKLKGFMAVKLLQDLGSFLILLSFGFSCLLGETHECIHLHILWSLIHSWSLSISICLSLFVLVVQRCPVLCNPTNCSPPGFSFHGILQGKNTGVDWCSLLQRIFVTQGSNPGIKPWSPALQADSLPFELGAIL